ncbi:MAG: tryptophan--tRNA ligase [Planctomycetota bacterium]|nr:tryptophan--tRNA ligase [Planctomycetota bacterium]
MRVLSGIQPSGRLHVGNYFGAVRQFLKLQAEGNECFYFIANYHALTSIQDKAELEAITLHVATAYLALGVEPEKSVFFCQSDVPQVAELCWILNCVCPVGLMEKCTSYKDKLAKGLPASMGLLDYPVLQAADIVIYDADLVPVGADQKQHIEMARDLAGKFNRTFQKDALVLPEPHIVPDVAVVPGIDGQKMSKSYNNTIEIFQTPKATQKQCARIVTDSTDLESPKDPERCNVYALLKLFADEAEIGQIADKYRAGGYGYGQAKKRLAELINEQFAAARDRYAELESRTDYVRDVLVEGGKKAREIAEATMNRVCEACGIVTNR